MRRLATLWVIATVSASAAGCGQKERPSPLVVCQKLEGAGVASDCHRGTPFGPGAGAVRSADFELAAVPEHEGAVYLFPDVASYDKAVDAFAAWPIKGPYRYGSRKMLIFVDLSPDTPSDVASKAKRVVDAL